MLIAVMADQEELRSSRQTVRQFRNLLAVVGAAVCLLMASVTAQSQTATAVLEPAGIVAQVSGDVRLDRAGASSQSLSGLDLLYAGDELHTGTGGRLLIRFSDDTLLDLAPNSRLDIETWGRQGLQLDRSRLVVTLHQGGSRWLTRDAGARYLLRAEDLSVRNVSPGASFELLQSETSGSEVIVHQGTLSAGNLGQVAGLGPDLRYARAVSSQTLETAPAAPDAVATRGPMPQESREIRFTRWPLLFPDTPREDVEGSVLWAESVTVRYRERSELPDPPQRTTGLMPLDAAPEEPEAVPETETEAAATEDAPAEPVATAEEDQLLLLSSLIRQRRHLEAFQLAESLRPEFEGEPDYDVLYARAALNVGENQRAVFALERALMVYPRQHDVRLMLVEAYLALGNTSAARRQLDRLENSTLTSAQQSRWNTLDRRLRRQKLAAQQTSAFTLGAELQYDTNINRGLNRSSLTIEPADGPAFEFSPDDDARAEGAPALQLQGSYSRSTPLSQRLRRNWQLGATTRQSSFDDAVNYGALLSVGLEHRNGRSGDLQLLPSWNTEGFQVTTRAAARQEDVFRSLDLEASLAWTAAEDQSVLLQTQVSDSIEIAAVRTGWRAGISANVSDLEGQNFVGLGGSLQPQWQPPGSFVYQGVLGLQSRFYLQDNPLYGAPRRDLQLNTELLALRPLSESSVLTGRMAYNQVFSNQGLYEFYGALLAIGYQYTW